ncbi:MAG: oligopeptide:H+ symporter, partial [Nannocystaceae bacterium]
MARAQHPKGLYRLFFTEMWERLAFYTMLNVLLLYSTDLERGGLGLTSTDGNQIYGLYLAFVYFTPFPGGMIADRFIGYRKAVLIGGLLMASGLFVLSMPGMTYFAAGLILLILGNGFFKPNISVMVGNLYEKGDARRDSGFNIFYMGINIGALISSFLASAVRNEAGWLWTFRVAGFGLLIGVIILLFSWKVLEKADRQPEVDPNDVGFGQVALKILLPAFLFGTAGFFAIKHLWALSPLRHIWEVSPVTPAVGGFLAGMVPVILFFRGLVGNAKPAEQPGLRTLLPIYVAGGTFFMILHLNGSAMTQWARDSTDRQVEGVPLDLSFSIGDFGVPISFEQEALPSYYLNAAEDVPRPDPRSLSVAREPKHASMFGQQRLDEQGVAAILAANAGVTLREFPVDVDKDTLSEADQAVLARAAKVYEDGAVTVAQADDGHGGTTISVSIPDGAKPKRMV